MALKRFVNGAAGEASSRSARRTTGRTGSGRSSCRSRPAGPPTRSSLDDAAGSPGSSTSAASTSTRTRSGPTTSTIPTSCASTSTRCPGVAWSQIREVALVAREALEAVGLVGWPKTSGSRGIHINVRIERRWTYPEVRRAALALARDVERRAPAIATTKWWKEERHGVFLDYNQNAKDRTVASAYSVAAAARRPGLDAALAGTRCRPSRPRPSRSRRCRRASPSDRRPGRRDRRGGRLARGAARAVARATRRRAWATRRGRRTTASRTASRRASSRRGSAAPTRTTTRRRPRRSARRTARRWRRGSPRTIEARRRRRRRAARGPRRPAGAGRRCRSSRSARAAKKDEALAGLERWKARHPDGRRGARAGRRAGRRHARPLHDSGTGSASTSPTCPRRTGPPQEPLDPDYDPMTEYPEADRAA